MLSIGFSFLDIFIKIMNMNSYGKNVFSASVQRTGVSVQSNMRIFVRLRTEMHTRYFRCSFMSKTSRKQHNIFQVNEAVNSIMLYEGGKGHNIYFELNGVVSKSLEISLYSLQEDQNNSVCTTILSCNRIRQCHILNKKIHTYKNNYKNHYENIFPNGRIQLNNIS